MRQNMILRRIDPVSAAKIAGVLYMLIGLLLGAFTSSLFMIGLAGAGAGLRAWLAEFNGPWR